MIPIAAYINPETRLPPYLPFARFLLKADLSLTAKIVYTVLLERMRVSQKNRWEDENGHSYVIYPVEEIAEEIDRGQTAVKCALNELSEYGLIEKIRPSPFLPCRICILLPDDRETDGRNSDGRKPDGGTDGKPTLAESENRSSDGRETDPRTDGFPPVNKNNRIKINNIKQKSDRTLIVYGRFENVLLTEEDYAALKQDNPRIDALIERLSAYMRSEGRTYADHAATLRLWMEREKKKTARSIPDYEPKEGESL